MSGNMSSRIVLRSEECFVECSAIGDYVSVMDSSPLERHHPDFPYRVWVVIEQPRNEPKRFRFLPETREFVRTKVDSLVFRRGFSGAYGWISGTGMPPDPHFDVLVLTERDVAPGAVVEIAIAGMFFMGSGDHKFVGVDIESSAFGKPDWPLLTPQIREELERTYPHVGEGEGWRGAAEARNHLLHCEPSHS
jgi:inorganic pyrophosphatase